MNLLECVRYAPPPRQRAFQRNGVFVRKAKYWTVYESKQNVGTPRARAIVFLLLLLPLAGNFAAHQAEIEPVGLYLFEIFVFSHVSALVFIMPHYLQVLRRTGPFPRRRKFRDLAGKKLAIKAAAAVGAVATSKVQKFATLTVREAFKRVTVPAGEDAEWEEAKPPSALQVRATAGRQRCSAARDEDDHALVSASARQHQAPNNTLRLPPIQPRTHTFRS